MTVRSFDFPGVRAALEEALAPWVEGRPWSTSDVVTDLVGALVGVGALPAADGVVVDVREPVSPVEELEEARAELDAATDRFRRAVEAARG